MADYTSDRTGANIDTVLDNADAGNIGKTSSGSEFTDWNLINKNGFFDAATNSPTGGSAYGFHVQSGNPSFATQFVGRGGSFYGRSKESGTWSNYALYHTGNTGVVEFGNNVAPVGVEAIRFKTVDATILMGSVGTGVHTSISFYNSNSGVGSIGTNGTSTSYNTSSDPRLKDFKAAPTDAEVNAKFDDLFGCFKTFNWKNDVDCELVWGFDAHACIDAGLDMGSEGEGSRDLALGDVYDTTPAEIDEDGVEIKAAIEHKVSPAGIDQSKAVPILLAKIEQLERRLAALEV